MSKSVRNVGTEMGTLQSKSRCLRKIVNLFSVWEIIKKKVIRSGDEVVVLRRANQVRP